MSDSPVVDLDVVSDERVGEGGFLAIRRIRLVNVHADGTRSREYLVDYLVRPKGLDAVVVVLWARDADGAVKVLLREGLRPPLMFGRTPQETPLADPPRSPYHVEVVAGIVEHHDRGEAGLRRRCSEEAHEEAGFVVPPERFESLGAGTFPTPGALPEKLYLYAAEVEPTSAVRPPGDGSPYEEGARCFWMGLEAAITGCVTGVIQDAKTEVALRRLAEHLSLPRAGRSA